MSDLQTRIAATLREHRLGYSLPEGFHCLSQTCDWCDNDLHFADHVAGVLVAELGLTQEKRPLPVFVEDVPWHPNWQSGQSAALTAELQRRYQEDQTPEITADSLRAALKDQAPTSEESS